MTNASNFYPLEDLMIQQDLYRVFTFLQSNPTLELEFVKKKGKVTTAEPITYTEQDILIAFVSLVRQDQLDAVQNFMDVNVNAVTERHRLLKMFLKEKKRNPTFGQSAFLLRNMRTSQISSSELFEKLQEHIVNAVHVNVLFTLKAKRLSL